MSGIYTATYRNESDPFYHLSVEVDGNEISISVDGPDPFVLTEEDAQELSDTLRMMVERVKGGKR